MVASDEPINPNNPIYAEVAVTSGRGGLVNTGYWGIPLTAGTEYYFSVYLALREVRHWPAACMPEPTATTSLRRTQTHPPAALEHAHVSSSTMG